MKIHTTDLKDPLDFSLLQRTTCAFKLASFCELVFRTVASGSFPTSGTAEPNYSERKSFHSFDFLLGIYAVPGTVLR